jgi:glycosyltransferase involved in cell wall biosynthesis
MKALLLDRIPQYWIAGKDDDPVNAAASGILLNDAGFLEALLKYGTFDRYYYLDLPLRRPLNRAVEPERLVRIDMAYLDTLRGNSELLLFRSGTDVSSFVPFRLYCEHPEWPICGLTHGLSDTVDIARYAFQSALKLMPYDSVICTTEGARTILARVYEGFARSDCLSAELKLPAIQYPVIPLGVEVDAPAAPSRSEARRRLGWAEDTFVCLYLGRLSPVNKSDLRPLIVTFLLAAELPESSILVLAGDDTALHIGPELEALGREMESSRKVVVRADITELQKTELLAAADVFVSLSDTLSETFGISVVEAMAAGLPVVVSDWNGYRELLTEGEEGFLIPTLMHGDTGELSAVCQLMDIRRVLSQRVSVDLGRLRTALAALARDKDLRRSMGTKARKTAVERFSWKSVIGRCEIHWDGQFERSQHWLRNSGGTRQQFPNPNYYDYATTFQHYPTHSLCSRCCLTPGPWLAKLDGYRRRGTLFRDGTSAFDSQLDDRILDFCGSPEGAPLDWLVERLATAASRAQVLLQASRLLKYGLLLAGCPNSYGKRTNPTH